MKNKKGEGMCEQEPNWIKYETEREKIKGEIKVYRDVNKGEQRREAEWYHKKED